MAEEVEMTPVEMTPVDMTPVAAEPPKADPLKTAGAPALPKPGATVALKPGLKLPPKPGATVAGLRPGLKLPPKPGATVALKPGLKLPPKPGATVSALKPGLKLPPKPGATVALKPGLKLPPTRPVIRKPGAVTAGAPLPKPVQSVPPPVAPVAETPAAPVAEAPKPVAEAPKPVEAPKPPVMPVDAQGVAKLPTVAAATLERPAAEKPAETPSEQLKKITQTLKGITQQIPQQAILRKTGIIAEDATTAAQKEAAKHKTARISLSEAIGVAPVKNENAPMKTIRIKRPIDIPGATAAKPAVPPPVSGDSPAAESGAPAADASAAAPATTITQRKTLKITRPGGGAVRPAGRFGVKRPASQATTIVKKPAEGAPAAADADAGAGEATVADIADIPNLPNIPDMPAPVAASDTTPGWLYALSALVQAAACLGIGALAWLLYQGTQTLFY